MEDTRFAHLLEEKGVAVNSFVGRLDIQRPTTTAHRRSEPTQTRQQLIQTLITFLIARLVILRTTGGEAPGGSALAPKIGPLGLSPKKIGDDIASATKEWKGLRVTVRLVIQNRQAKVEILPSASSLVIKALKEPPRDRKKEKNGMNFLRV